jgi:hypothetical protein
LRSENRYVSVRDRVRYNDAWRGRDVEAVEKTVDGLLKLLYPDPSTPISTADLHWAVELATVSRRRVKEAQAYIGVDEFGAIDLGFSVDAQPEEIPQCPESSGRLMSLDIDFPDLGPVSSPSSPGLPALIPDPLPTGFTLFGFGRVIDQPIAASGAFGRIYRVERDFDGRVLAGKVFRKDPDAPYASIADEALRQEVKALEALSHPNIVRVLGPIAVSSRGEWMVVSEWIEGSTLDDFTRGPKVMSGAEIHRTGSQLLDAMTYLESLGVVHRDLKPANVMIDNDGIVKIIDFNLTRDSGHMTVMAGTPAYMPPDFMNLGARVDGFVDRYGVAVMLYELIVGAHPYEGEFAAGRYPTPTSRPTDPSTLRPDVSPAIAQFLLKGVAPTDAERYSNAKEMRQEWRSLGPEIQALA